MPNFPTDNKTWTIYTHLFDVRLGGRDSAINKGYFTSSESIFEPGIWLILGWFGHLRPRPAICLAPAGDHWRVKGCKRSLAFRQSNNRVASCIEGIPTAITSTSTQGWVFNRVGPSLQGLWTQGRRIRRARRRRTVRLWPGHTAQAKRHQPGRCSALLRLDVGTRAVTSTLKGNLYLEWWYRLIGRRRSGEER